MRAIIETKMQEVNALTEKIQDSSSVVIVDYRGLTVEEVTELRSKLRAEGAEIKVIKNNIVRRASEAAGHGDLVQHLTGPNAIAFGGADAVAPAKVIYDFAKEHEALELKAGVIDGNYANQELITQYAQLPSRETLLTMLAGGMLQPLRDLGIGLHMYTEELEEGADAPATEEVAEETPAAEETATEEKTEENAE